MVWSVLTSLWIGVSGRWCFRYSAIFLACAPCVDQESRSMPMTHGATGHLGRLVVAKPVRSGLSTVLAG